MFVEVTPPNLNADLYKNYQEVNKVYNHLSFINIHPDGTTVVGASDLTGRHWDGTIQISKTSWDFVLESSADQNITKIFTDNSVTDGRVLKDSTKIIVADDSGELKIWSRQKSWTDNTGTPSPQYGWCVWGQVTEHDDAILALDMFNDDSLGISAGADSIIKVWDLEKLVSVKTYPAHCDLVTDAMCNPYVNNVFLSCSLDKTVALWQYKGTENKAKVFGKMPCAVRCVCWISDTLFAAGYDNGDICFFDSRYESTEQVLPSIQAKHPIERMKFNQESKLLAMCGDSSSVDVYKISETDSISIYCNDTSHTQFVRGLDWDGSCLYSVGWDGKVVNHDMSTNAVHMK